MTKTRVTKSSVRPTVLVSYGLLFVWALSLALLYHNNTASDANWILVPFVLYIVLAPVVFVLFWRERKRGNGGAVLGVLLSSVATIMVVATIIASLIAFVPYLS